MREREKEREGVHGCLRYSLGLLSVYVCFFANVCKRACVGVCVCVWGVQVSENVQMYTCVCVHVYG